MKKPARNVSRVFVTGTDTGVGKTVVSLLLMRYLHARGQEPFYIKLVQTGCTGPYSEESDARFIYENVPELNGKDSADSVACCYLRPKAPWFAARDEGKAVDVQYIKEFVDRNGFSHQFLVMEGAGGLLVPLDDRTLMIDLISRLNARPILVARAGLGTINHTLLSIEALHARGVSPLGIIFLDSGEPASPEEMVRENMEAVERFSGIRPAGIIGRIRDFSATEGQFDPLFASIFV
ncbi:MAG: dethiobiotin synthase [Syntrophobacteraceae bacterium]